MRNLILSGSKKEQEKNKISPTLFICLIISRGKREAGVCIRQLRENADGAPTVRRRLRSLK